MLIYGVSVMNSKTVNNETIFRMEIQSEFGADVLFGKGHVVGYN